MLHFNVSDLKIENLTNFIMLFPFLILIYFVLLPFFYDWQGHVTQSCKGPITSWNLWMPKYWVLQHVTCYWPPLVLQWQSFGRLVGLDGKMHVVFLLKCSSEFSEPADAKELCRRVHLHSRYTLVNICWWSCGPLRWPANSPIIGPSAASKRYSR